MLVVNTDETLSVTGNLTFYNQYMDIDTKKENTFSIIADIKEKCGFADKMNRDTYWYYGQGADLISESGIPTSEQYYCVFVYVNTAGKFLSVSHWDLAKKSTGVDNLIRPGKGKADRLRTCSFDSLNPQVGNV